jgi:formylmethanofuran dehydrogenase subunit E
MRQSTDFPKDFERCVKFHGHSCPGLAIGYAAAKAAQRTLNVGAAPDEEIVAVVENDSCAVDAIQVLLGCTFGKGNLVFLDRGKQVFTIMDRSAEKAVRVSFKGPVPFQEERRALKERIDSGRASDEEKKVWSRLRTAAILKLIQSEPSEFFDIREVLAKLPPKARVVVTVFCDLCGEPTVSSRIVERHGRLMCAECALSR